MKNTYKRGDRCIRTIYCWQYENRNTTLIHDTIEQ